MQASAEKGQEKMIGNKLRLAPAGAATASSYASRSARKSLIDFREIKVSRSACKVAKRCAIVPAIVPSLVISSSTRWL